MIAQMRIVAFNQTVVRASSSGHIYRVIENRSTQFVIITLFRIQVSKPQDGLPKRKSIAPDTVRYPGMGTVISEASKRVS